MALVKLTHPLPNYELFVDMNDVVSIERKNLAEQGLILQPDQEPAHTRLTLRSGKQLICLDAPEVLLPLMT